VNERKVGLLTLTYEHVQILFVLRSLHRGSYWSGPFWGKCSVVTINLLRTQDRVRGEVSRNWWLWNTSTALFRY